MLTITKIILENNKKKISVLSAEPFVISRVKSRIWIQQKMRAYILNSFSEEESLLSVL